MLLLPLASCGQTANYDPPSINPPNVLVTLLGEDESLQTTTAIRLTTSWCQDDVCIMEDSPHPLQLPLSQFEEATVYLDAPYGYLLFELDQDLAPSYTSHIRWPTYFLLNGQPSDDAFNSYEVFDHPEGVIINSGGDYIFMITMRWSDIGSSAIYTFRLVTTN